MAQLVPPSLSEVLPTRPSDCLKYFEEFGPVFVEWLNDSACNVLFADPPSAKRAMVGRGRPLPPTEGTPGAGVTGALILCHTVMLSPPDRTPDFSSCWHMQAWIPRTSPIFPTCGTKGRPL